MSTSPTPPSTNQPPAWPATPPPATGDAAGHDPIRQWGTSPTPPEPKPKRGGRILLAAAIGVVLLVATGCVANAAPPDTGPDRTPPTTPNPGPTDRRVMTRPRHPILPRGTRSPSRSRSLRESRSPHWSA